ncbi:MAG: hypothetical protein ACYC5J_10970 [Chloroflexota bacterium]
MGIGSTGTATLPQGFARLELGPGTPTFSPGQIVNGRVAQVGPRGVVIEVAGRLATMLSDLQLDVGEMIQLSVKEASRDQTLLQLVGREGQLLAAQAGVEPQLARLMGSYKLPVDRFHLNAVRKLLARGLPITRENLARLAESEGLALGTGLDPESTDLVLLRLIDSYDLPLDEPHRYAARQLLARRLPITREGVEQLARTLARFRVAGEVDFQMATYLQANRLPLTPSSLAVMRSTLVVPGGLGPRLHQLRWGLSYLADLLQGVVAEGDPFGAGVLRLVDRAAQELSRRMVGASGADRAQLEEGLRRVLRDQGTSLESRLVRILMGQAGVELLEEDLRFLLGRLAALSAEAAQEAESGAAGADAQGARALGRAPGAAAGTGAEAADGSEVGPPREEAGEATSIASEDTEAPPGVEDDPEELPEAAGPAKGVPPTGAAADEGEAEGAKAATGTTLPRAAPRDAVELKALLPERPDLRQALVRLGDSAPGLADALQAQQLRNAGRSPDPFEQWLVFQVPLARGPEEPPTTVELRIGRRTDRRLDPHRVRLVMRLELERLETVEVRLEIIGKQVSCQLASSIAASLPVLRERFPSLREGLEGLGYSVAPAGFGLLSGDPDPAEVAVQVPPRLVQVDLRA